MFSWALRESSLSYILLKFGTEKAAIVPIIMVVIIISVSVKPRLFLMICFFFSKRVNFDLDFFLVFIIMAFILIDKLIIS
ncbi:MAG: hypothetical protein A2Y03_03920 [Omnitrophica WOR_2 bacterium GWF2_38_59]|nr:MAG: hypothetical protein A2Y06_01085 [Omnitrophica WOR_2 bacterium GWA2_37_7]OGX22318.1 MAG: hypothetical protein A2Y03_03920 [Omnitrophica WOR_2 bacterium GWF2_38_59]OGX50275.1 MAG: hypothetical protein A2243_07200 [Omnitrophica WOR_2 bacterium RIFOXYA2_FULL_38_17]OGX50881.1 MAG: hypothetical protein A2267_00905 [Omnitrophica WOR_2 bacterium RIFOXYA12_FULL_38_10]OGX56716.1 MAG: hypothetical protein A2306_02135 [Omnitrophica WOR_2 bacterium RIFOXYB2_FULL_38_16]OGX58914.1 MAG: hypothetical 